MNNEFRKKLKELIRDIYEKELEEVTTTGDIDGYSTPFAFKDTKKGYRKQKKKNMQEALDSSDMSKIKILIRNVIADVIRDIWIKRTAWR